MDIELLPYQKEAVKKLRSGSILVGGVGSGKSLTSLFFFTDVICKDQARDLYIITTAAKRNSGEWTKECQKLDIPENVHVKIDSWNNIQKYVNVIGAFFIFDEQRLTGSGAWVKTFYRIALRNKWILLTATPGDNWMAYIPVFVANGFYKNKTEFCRRHVVFNQFVKYPKVERYLETDRLRRLRDYICVVMHYRRPTQIHYELIPTEYDQKLYSQTCEVRWNFYKDEPIRNASEHCQVLRKIVNSDSSRIEQVKEILRVNPKVIIFYNFDYELDILRQIGKELDVPVSELNGHKHTDIPKKSSTWMHLVQYNAGAEGWNCIETNVMIFFSLNYAYWMMEQASGRIDRMNTPFMDLYYYILYSDSSIDSGILRCLKNKETFNENKFIA